MGGTKAAAMLAGRALASYPVEAIAAAGLEPMVVAKRTTELPELDCRLVFETEPTSHPAAGILAALRSADGRAVVAIACDMPFVPPELILRLASLDAVVATPSFGGRRQPLVARYAPAAAAALERALRAGEPMDAVLEELDTLVLGERDLCRFGDPGRIMFNVNDRDDLEAAERLMAPATSR